MQLKSMAKNASVVGMGLECRINRTQNSSPEPRASPRRPYLASHVVVDEVARPSLDLDDDGTPIRLAENRNRCSRASQNLATAAAAGDTCRSAATTANVASLRSASGSRTSCMLFVTEKVQMEAEISELLR